MASPSSSPSSSPPPPSLPLLPPPTASTPKTEPDSESKPSPAKKTPPLPWTHQETINLIQAYQEKWYSLKKGQLKASQWEEVAATVAARCGFDVPSKTATQCRHKIEKLRKRYRAERVKPYPNSWQYFNLMDEMERGPLPLTARPLVTVSNNGNVNGGTNHSSSGNFNLSNYSGSADYYYYNHNEGSDDSEEEWNMSYGGDAKKNRSKSINNIVRTELSSKSGNKSVNKMGMDRSMNGSGNRAIRSSMNGRGKRYYEEDYDDTDNEEEGYQGEEEVMAGKEEWSGGMELAAEIRGFAERFMRVENKKIEMMRETERYRMEIENKRMEMIIEAQRKIVDTIGRAFGAHKKVKMDQDT